MIYPLAKTLQCKLSTLKDKWPREKKENNARYLQAKKVEWESAYSEKRVKAC